MNRYLVLFLACLVYLVYSVWPEPLEKETLPIPVCAQAEEARAEIGIKPTQIDGESNPIRRLQVSQWQISEQEFRSRWGIQDHHEIKPVEFESPLGVERVYRFSQNGIPIIGMEIRLKKLLDGSVLEVDNSYRPISALSISESVLSERALRLPAEVKRYQLSAIDKESTVIFVRKNLNEGELAFTASGSDKVLSNRTAQLILRVEDGQILHRSFGRSDFNF